MGKSGLYIFDNKVIRFSNNSTLYALDKRGDDVKKHEDFIVNDLYVIDNVVMAFISFDALFNFRTENGINVNFGLDLFSRHIVYKYKFNINTDEHDFLNMYVKHKQSSNKFLLKHNIELKDEGNIIYNKTDVFF